MSLAFEDLEYFRKNHPAWRLVTADHAPLVASFLDVAFREPNHRYLPESQLTVLLEDQLYELRKLRGDEAFPRTAGDYLDDWAENGWLRKFYPQGTDEPHYDLTPETERALQWMDGLVARQFVGTESRLFTALALLRQIVHGVEADPGARVARLESERAQIDRHIEEIRAGSVPMMDERTLRERFLLFGRTARELLSDFRAVEHNFRELDRRVREKIAGWSEGKGELLQSVFGEQDQIADSDEGRSFRAFWDFLMSPESQEELNVLLDRVGTIVELGELRDDRRLRHIHHDWMDAGEHTQRTVARLSQQLRRFLDDQTFLENRRIVQILDRIGHRCLDLRDDPPRGTFIWMAGERADIGLPLERPLYAPSDEAALDQAAEEEEVEIDVSSLFDQVAVDRVRLLDQIDRALIDGDQVALPALVERYPLQEGLAELVTYVAIATDSPLAMISEDEKDRVLWVDRTGVSRVARIPRIVFQRSVGLESR